MEEKIAIIGPGVGKTTLMIKKTFEEKEVGFVVVDIGPKG